MMSDNKKEEKYIDHSDMHSDRHSDRHSNDHSDDKSIEQLPIISVKEYQDFIDKAIGKLISDSVRKKSKLEKQLKIIKQKYPDLWVIINKDSVLFYMDSHNIDGHNIDGSASTKNCFTLLNFSASNNYFGENQEKDTDWRMKNKEHDCIIGLKNINEYVKYVRIYFSHMKSSYLEIHVGQSREIKLPFPIFGPVLEDLRFDFYDGYGTEEYHDITDYTIIYKQIIDPEIFETFTFVETFIHNGSYYTFDYSECAIKDNHNGRECILSSLVI